MITDPNHHSPADKALDNSFKRHTNEDAAKGALAVKAAKLNVNNHNVDTSTLAGKAALKSTLDQAWINGKVTVNGQTLSKTLLNGQPNQDFTNTMRGLRYIQLGQANTMEDALKLGAKAKVNVPNPRESSSSAIAPR